MMKRNGPSPSGRAAAVALFACLSACANIPRVGDLFAPAQWREYEGAHFLLRTDESEAEAEEALETLEDIRTGFARIISDSDRDELPPRLRVILFRSLDDLWSWRGSLNDEPDGRTANYATSWLWVHYLVNERPEAFQSFLRRLEHAEPPRAAFSAEFPDLVGAQLGPVLAQYRKRGTFTKVRLHLHRQALRIQRRPMSEGDVHAMWAAAWLDAVRKITPEDRASRALAEVKAALAADPCQPDAVVLSLQLEPPLRSAGDAAKCLERYPSHPGLAVAAAEALSSTHDEVLAHRAERVLAVALEKQPEEPFLLSRWGRALLIQNRPHEAAAALRKALDLAPASPSTLFLFSVAAARDGRCQDAGAALARARNLLADRAESAKGPLAELAAQVEHSCPGGSESGVSRN